MFECVWARALIGPASDQPAFSERRSKLGLPHRFPFARFALVFGISLPGLMFVRCYLSQLAPAEKRVDVFEGMFEPSVENFGVVDVRI